MAWQAILVEKYDAALMRNISCAWGHGQSAFCSYLTHWYPHCIPNAFPRRIQCFFDHGPPITSSHTTPWYVILLFGAPKASLMTASASSISSPQAVAA